MPNWCENILYISVGPSGGLNDLETFLNDQTSSNNVSKKELLVLSREKD